MQRLVVALILCLVVISISGAATASLAGRDPLGLAPASRLGREPGREPGRDLARERLNAPLFWLPPTPAGLVPSLAGCAFQATWLAIVALFVPARIRRMAQALRAPLPTLWRVLVVGALGGVAGAALGFLGVFSGGLGASLPAFFAVLYVGFNITLSSVALAVGHFLRGRLALGPLPPLVEVILGSIALYTLFSLPVIGIGLLVLAALAALGVGVSTRLGSEHGWQFENLSQRLSLGNPTRDKTA